MKLSRLKTAIDKALEAYGDMEVGAYDRDYCNSVCQLDIHDIQFRVLSEDECDVKGLPGESFDQEEAKEAVGQKKYAVIFYEC